ncbi:uncharacterized protein LOC110705098 [Chenopodium quinoa]|uniref:uncharacterized protein LOC110705098 n=1 Tax=Chenopodium quinoa TaxID=63459 RepID=UPI000B79866D|nr:uncharacterized protein LOC110705098 [Chenopodium quinoa]
MVNIVNCYMSLLQKTMKLAGMRPKKLEIEPGTTIHFWVNSNKTKKKKNKKPLVLIHGFAGNGLITWSFQILALRKKYDLYIPDLVFFGESYTTTKSTEVTPRFHADYFAKGLRKLGVEEKCVVIGFSYGGFVAFQMAEHHPDLVYSIVAIGTVSALSESLSRECSEQVGGRPWSEYLVPQSAEDVKVLFDISFHRLPRMPKFCYKHWLESMYDHRKEKVDLLEAALIKDEDVPNHQFKQKIHLLWGTEDRVFNLEVGIAQKKKLGGTTELQIITNAGHLVQLERPCAFNKCLKNILDSLAIDKRLTT